MFTRIFQGDLVEGGLTSEGNQKRPRESPSEHTEQGAKTTQALTHTKVLSTRQWPNKSKQVSTRKSFVFNQQKPYVNFLPEKFLPVIKSTEVLQEKKSIIII